MITVICIYAGCILLVLGAMVMAGDLRITKRQQREWEEYWAAMTPKERERMARLTHGIA